MKTIYITEAQKKKIKKAIAAQDQVGGKVNAGVMDAVAYGGGMCENVEENNLGPYFETWYRGYDSKYPNLGVPKNQGMWITDEIEYAKLYADEFGKDGKIAKVVIDIRKVKHMSEGDMWDMDIDPYYSDETTCEIVKKQGYNSWLCYYWDYDAQGLCLIDSTPIVSIEDIDESEYSNYVEENVEKDAYELGAEKGMSPYYHIVNESMEDVYNVIEDYGFTEYKLLDEFRRDKQNGIKVKKWNLIPAQQYHTLLKRYMASPEMARIPYNVVNEWFISIIIPNACDIEFITNFAGHSSNFNVYEINDFFGENLTGYKDGSEYLDSIGFYDWCKLPDGSDAWSDYGLEPIFKIISEYSPNLSAEEILILINRCIDVVHCRGDLASAFIQGGRHSCDYISNNVNENIKNNSYYHVNESNEEIITLYHGVNRKGLEFNLENRGFIPRVCSEGGPKAVWLSEKQYNYEFTFAFDFPKSLVEQLSNVDYIFTNKIGFNDFNCRLVKTSISSYLDGFVVETNILDERLSKLHFRYFPDLGIILWKEFKQYPNILETYINPFIEKYQKLQENVESEVVNPEDVDLSSFNIKKNLNPKFWKNGVLDSRIRLKLLDIADDFIEFLGIDWAKPEDITMTGSLANFNWDENYSDIDLHVIMDYSDVDEKTEFVSNYFYSQKKLWNEEHSDITIMGYPVEVFVQDVNERHDSSGVYSLEKNKWLIEPEREKLASSKVNKAFIKDKVSEYMNKIDKLEYLLNKSKDDEYRLRRVMEKSDKLFDKIKGERKIGFERSGGKEINNYNIVFKALRRNGYIEKLVNVKSMAYDKLNSLR